MHVAQNKCLVSIINFCNRRTRGIETFFSDKTVLTNIRSASSLLTFGFIGFISAQNLILKKTGQGIHTIKGENCSVFYEDKTIDCCSHEHSLSDAIHWPEKKHFEALYLPCLK